MAAEFKEVAHLRTDKKKFDDNYKHIFEKDICECEECKSKREKSCLEQTENRSGEREN